MKKILIISLLALLLIPLASAVTVTRSFSADPASPGGAVTVTLQVTTVAADRMYAINEIYPPGWAVTDKGSFEHNIADRALRTLQFSSSSSVQVPSATYTYSLSILANAATNSPYNFPGTFDQSSGSTPIGGDNSLTVQSAAPSCTPNPCNNGGTCSIVSGSVSSVSCVCSPGFTGNRCQTASANQLPVAQAMTIATLQDTQVNILLRGSDADGTVRGYTIVTVPVSSSGRLIGPGGDTVTPNSPVGATVTYVPATNFVGNSFFTYTVTDDQGGVSSEATVILTVTAAGWLCTGNFPDNANLCDGDDTDLTVNAARTAVSVCTASAKCEYLCNAGFQPNAAGDNCVDSSSALCTEGADATGSYAEDSNGKKYDNTCEGDNLVSDYHCKNGRVEANTMASCPNGCLNGACVSGGGSTDCAEGQSTTGTPACNCEFKTLGGVNYNRHEIGGQCTILLGRIKAEFEKPGQNPLRDMVEIARWLRCYVSAARAACMEQ